MKKSSDIFANCKSLLLDSNFLKVIDKDIFHNSTKEFQTTSWNMTLTLRITSLYESVRLFNYAKVEDDDESLKVYCEEHKSHTCLKAYLRAYRDSGDYWVVKSFAPTENGFERACHWLDNKRQMLMERMEDWLDSK